MNHENSVSPSVLSSKQAKKIYNQGKDVTVSYLQAQAQQIEAMSNSLKIIRDREKFEDQKDRWTLARFMFMRGVIIAHFGKDGFDKLMEETEEIAIFEKIVGNGGLEGTGIDFYTFGQPV